MGDPFVLVGLGMLGGGVFAMASWLRDHLAHTERSRTVPIEPDEVIPPATSERAQEESPTALANTPPSNLAPREDDGVLPVRHSANPLHRIKDKFLAGNLRGQAEVLTQAAAAMTAEARAHEADKARWEAQVHAKVAQQLGRDPETVDQAVEAAKENNDATLLEAKTRKIDAKQKYEDVLAKSKGKQSPLEKIQDKAKISEQKATKARYDADARVESARGRAADPKSPDDKAPSQPDRDALLHRAQQDLERTERLLTFLTDDRRSLIAQETEIVDELERLPKGSPAESARKTELQEIKQRINGRNDEIKKQQAEVDRLRLKLAGLE